jgi:putative transcriptional regulator
MVFSVSVPEPSPISLSGSLLLSHPNMTDPNFHRTVLFISTHDLQEGSFGLIVNRPAGHTVGDLLPNKPLGSLARVPVLLGGPVQQDQLIFASFRWHDETQRMECRHHLLIPEAQDALAEEHTEVRAFIGYAGWSKGQLEGELAQNAWIVEKPARDLLTPERAPAMWRRIISAQGPHLRLLAEAPDDPSAN